MTVDVYSGEKVTAEIIAGLKEVGPVIGTHDTTFHCDEIVACSLLRTIKPYQLSSIVRTRDDQLLKLCDIVVDVGAEYDKDRCRFDHHQRGFSDTWSENNKKTKLSSAGLIWKHFGVQILQEKFGVKPDDVDWLHNELYELIIESIDANDNGVTLCECKDELQIKFRGGMPSMGAMVSHKNVSWCMPDRMDETKCFKDAVAIVENYFFNTLSVLASHYKPAKDEVMEAIRTRAKVHESQRIIELINYFRYWKFVRRFDAEVNPKIDFVIWCEPGVEEWNSVVLGENWSNPKPTITFPRKEAILEAYPDIRSDDIVICQSSRLVCKSREVLLTILGKL